MLSSKLADFSLCIPPNLSEISGVPNFSRKPWLKTLLAFAFWTLIGLAFAGQLYLSRAKIGDPVSWSFAMGRALGDWYVFALLSIPALWLARKFSLGDSQWVRNLCLHFLASALFSMAWMSLRTAVELWLNRDSALTFADAFNRALVTTFFYNLLIYWVIISVGYAFDYYRKFNERELRTAELEKRLTEARLQALQMQLNPHFLFNTLHAISALMHRDVDAADKMLVRLSDLLRRALESTDTQEVPLREELDFLSRYAEIEQARFGERLKIEMNIAPTAFDALVPNLVLQPLLENAIRHGIEPHARAGRIEINARRDGDLLCLEVRDNGGGLVNGEPVEGVGLSNTRSRLAQLYGHRQSFNVEDSSAGGVVVRVELPFHTS
jgi:signal transduction histidine kinase